MGDLQSKLRVEMGTKSVLSGGGSINDPLVVHSIEVKDRGKGNGTKAMQAITDYADAHGLAVALTPDGMFGSSVPRLTRFYRRFGFVPNKGRSRDFSTRESMIRPATPAVDRGDQMIEPAQVELERQQAAQPGEPIEASPADTNDLVSSVQGDSDRSEYIRRALRARVEYGDRAHTFITRDPDGKISGAVSLIDRTEVDPDEAEMGVRPAIVIDYLGGQGGGVGSGLVEQAKHFAIAHNADLLLETTPQSKDFWIDKMKAGPDPQGNGSPFYGWTFDELKAASGG